MSSGSESEVVFLPEFRGILYPASHQHGVLVDVAGDAGSVLIEVLNSDLSALQFLFRRGLRLKFNHDPSSPSAGIPLGFRWEPGVGVILRVRFSKAARWSILNGYCTYFSPEFLIDRQGKPAGLPRNGQVGSLVDVPGFRTMKKLKIEA